MNIIARRIRLHLDCGQWTYWLSPEELRRYRSDQIKEVVIEETMSYADAMKYIGVVK